MGDVVMGVCYRLPQQEEADEPFQQQQEESYSYALVFMGHFNYPDVCW